MPAIIIAIFLVIGLMLTLMFIMLRKIIKVLNDKSKTYFVNKLQDYDELIETKSKQLQTLNQQIKEIETVKVANGKIFIEKKMDDDYYEINNPYYKNENIFKNYKKICEKFKYENVAIITKFLEENVDNHDNNTYRNLISVKNKLTFNIIYNLVVLDSNKQIEEIKKMLTKEEKNILDNYSQQEFNVLEFNNYLDDMIRDYDPTVCVKVGTKDENYDHLNSLIKTSYDENICKGIQIIYKNKLYDYSLF